MVNWSRSRKTVIIGALAIAIFAGLILIHFAIAHAKVRVIVQEEFKSFKGPEVWGQPQDGIQTMLEFRGLKEIGYSSGGAIMYSVGKTFSTHEWYQYPSRGTMPHLLVKGWVKNASNKTVYLIGDKSRNGTSAPAYLQIQVQHANDLPRLLNLHPDPFEYQGVVSLEPGRTQFFLEYIPYDAFSSFAPDCKLVGLISFVYAKPSRDQVVKADAVSYSAPLTPPWEVLKLYFDLVQ